MIKTIQELDGALKQTTDANPCETCGDMKHIRLQREVLRSALKDCVRYMVDQGVSHEYAVMIRAKRALQYTEK